MGSLDRETKKFFLIVVTVIVVIYSAMALFTYNSIQSKAVQLEILQEKIVSDEADYKDKRTYEDGRQRYLRLQTRLQSFWMKYLFEFPEFEKIN